jgi:hypothetical protein
LLIVLDEGLDGLIDELEPLWAEWRPARFPDGGGHFRFADGDAEEGVAGAPHGKPSSLGLHTRHIFGINRFDSERIRDCLPLAIL